MFEKVISEALMSPSMIGELGRYKKRLDKSVNKKAWIVVLSITFVFLQYTALFIPLPREGANDTDTIYGGLSNKEALLREYNSKKSDFYNAAISLGITKEELQNSKEGDSKKSFLKNNHSLLIAWAKTPTYEMPFSKKSASQQEVRFLASHDTFKYYGYPLQNTREKQSEPMFIGSSAKAGNFAVLKNSGNFITSNNTADVCYKTPGDEEISYLHCLNGEQVITSITAQNLRYHTDALIIKNRPGDRLSYLLSIQNKKTAALEITPALYIGDILEYSTLLDYSGATFDEQAKTITWPRITIQPNQSASYTFRIKIVDTLPLSPQGSTNSYSYNCKLDSFFGTSHSIAISCPTPKVIERFLRQPISNSFLAIGWIGIGLNTVLLIRVRLQRKQILLILKNIRSKHA